MTHGCIGKYLFKYCYSSGVTSFIALERDFHQFYKEMLDQKLLLSIEDHSHGIYNYYRSDEWLNCYRSYGYLVNPAVGSIIADWWKNRKIGSDSIYN